MAERGRVVPEVDEPAARELIVGSYRLIYEIREESVFVLALIHGARDLAALWDEETGSAPRGAKRGRGPAGGGARQACGVAATRRPKRCV
jgi:hypothetical protein